MTGIDPGIITHSLKVDLTFKPVQQKGKIFSNQKVQAIDFEVTKLPSIGKIHKVKYPQWLANVVVVKKKNIKDMLYVDYTDLNKACPKDPFSLPHIDLMVNATIGHGMLSFMNAFLGITDQDEFKK